MAHPDVIINGVTYTAVPEVQIPKSGGGTVTFYATDDADAVAGSILSGVKAYGASGLITGNITSYPVGTENLTTKAQVSSWSAGYYRGITVQIASAEQAKIISSNIKSGITILGVSGSSVVVDTTLSTGAATANKIMTGYSAFVNGSKVDGSLTVPTISQDSGTHVLSIS